MTEIHGGDASNSRIKVIVIAIGGATCSGKTTLAKHLRTCLKDSFIIHQDDFAPPQDLVPVHPIYNVQDWDDAPGAIEWQRFVAFLEEIKHTGVLPDTHKSHDHLNENKEVPVEDSIVVRWRQESERVAREHQEKYGVKVVWAIVDGFLMYWNKQVVDQMDVCILLRTPHDVLKQRRHDRHGYHTAEGALWRDPPHYWEQIVYPAYVRAHSHLFEGGDVEHGMLTDQVAGLLLFEATWINMETMLTMAMDKIMAVTSSR